MMGDADGEISVPIQEIESWMDEALEVVDEGLDQLFLSLINAKKQTKKVLIKLKRLECFRNCFIAMNLLIVPVIFSILICYSTRQKIDSTGLEAGFQIAVTFLMFLSGSVGLPYYLLSLLKSYKCARKLKDEENTGKNSEEIDSDIMDGLSMFEDSFLNLMTNEDSAERMNQFARMLVERMPDSLRTNLESRRNLQVSEVGTLSEESENRRMLPVSNFSSDLIRGAIVTSSNPKIEMKYESKAVDTPTIENGVISDCNEMQMPLESPSLPTESSDPSMTAKPNEEDNNAIQKAQISLQEKNDLEENRTLKSDREVNFENMWSVPSVDLFASDEFF